MRGGVGGHKWMVWHSGLLRCVAQMDSLYARIECICPRPGHDWRPSVRESNHPCGLVSGFIRWLHSPGDPYISIVAIRHPIRHQYDAQTKALALQKQTKEPVCIRLCTGIR